MRAALYARISTHEGKQFTENQIAEMVAFAERRGWTITGAPYVDEASGNRGDRTALRLLLAHAHRRNFDVVIVWALDRFTREGVLRAFAYIEELKAAGVEFVSVTEPQFSTAGPHAELFIALAAWMSKQERERIRERVRAGIGRARAEGKTLGRPAIVCDIERARDLMTAGNGLRATARMMKIGTATLKRRLTKK